MAYVVLCAIAAIAYANSFGLGFALDGRSKILTDTRVQAASAKNLNLILTKHYWWPRPTDRLYRPVTLASYLFNYAVLGNGTAPAGYHVLNLLLHILNVCLLFELALLVVGSREVALFAAALWAVHPVQTEAVANVAGRADLLSAAAVLGGLLIYIRSIEMAGRRKQWWLAVFFAVAITGFFSKENAVALAGLMVLWDVALGWQRKPGWKSRQAAYVLIAAAAGVLFIVRWKIFEGEPWPESPFLDNSIRDAAFLPGRMTAIAVIGRYLGLLVWPEQLSFDYAYKQVQLASLAAAGPWIALLVVGGILGIVTFRYRADRTLFWAVGFFAVALLPTSNLLFPIGAIMALRFLYLPSAGLAVAVAVLIMRLNRPAVTRALMGLIIAAMAARTLARNPAWGDNLTLASADVQSAPDSFRTHQLLAQSLYGKDPKANLDQAIREYEVTYRILDPLPPADSCPPCLSELGGFDYAKAISVGGEKTPEGRAWLEKAVVVLCKGRIVSAARASAFDDAQVAHGLPLLQMEGDMNVYLYLAKAYTHLGRVDDAIQTYRQAQWINPKNRDVYDGLATAYASQGKLEQAAIVIDEKAFVLGINNATEASLRNLYARIPDGACALKIERGTPELNLDCPRVRVDMCAGWGELDAAFRADRQTGTADSIRSAALQKYGCPAEVFSGGR